MKQLCTYLNCSTGYLLPATIIGTKFTLATKGWQMGTNHLTYCNTPYLGT